MTISLLWRNFGQFFFTTPLCLLRFLSICLSTASVQAHHSISTGCKTNQLFTLPPPCLTVHMIFVFVFLRRLLVSCLCVCLCCLDRSAHLLKMSRNLLNPIEAVRGGGTYYSFFFTLFLCNR